MRDRNDCISNSTLAVLAGGAGRRMGMPKAALQVCGQPILRWMLESLRWPGATLLVTAPGRERPAGSEGFDREAVDPVARGPLGGILTALQHLTTPYLLVITVDMPGVGMPQLQSLLGRLHARADLMGLMSRRAGEIEPFPLACRAAGLGALQRQLAEGKGSVRGLSELDGFVAEPAPAEWGAQVWRNLNTAEDFRAFVREGSGGSGALGP